MHVEKTISHVLRAAALAALAGLATPADKSYGINTGMKIHGNQGKEEDQPKVEAAAESIKCSVCTTLVEDLWNKTAGIDYDPGETGRVIKNEDNVFALIEDTCRGRAPLFTQQHEVLELTGQADAAKMRFKFQEALDGPSNWPAGVPRPMVMMNWQTLAMKRACEAVIFENDVDIAEMVFLGVNAPVETNIDLAAVSDEVCIGVTNACPESARQGGKERKISGFFHAAKGKRPAQQEDRRPQLEAAEAARVAKSERALTANNAARAVRCELCMLLVEDLWAKVLGLGSEADPATTEDQMFDMIDKTCGKGGRPVPFRGAYELTQSEGAAFALRRRMPPIPANEVADNAWEAEALKIGCQDFVASMETEIAEQFYLMVEGREVVIKENKTAAAVLQQAGGPMFGRLCEQRCTAGKKKKKKKKKKSKSEL